MRSHREARARTSGAIHVSFLVDLTSVTTVVCHGLPISLGPAGIAAGSVTTSALGSSPAAKGLLV